MVNHGISLEFDSSVRTPESDISGTVKIDLSRVKDRGITEINVSMIGELRTAVYLKSPKTASAVTTVESRQGGERLTLVNHKINIWKTETFDGPSLARAVGGILPLPFSFRLSGNDEWPPTFEQVTGEGSASMKYYIKVTGVQKNWYKSNISITRPFNFLPLDQSPPPSISIRPKKVWKKEASIRKGLFVHTAARAEVEVCPSKFTRAIILTPPKVSLPGEHTFPICQAIPIDVRVKGISKPYSSKKGSNGTSGYPLPPTNPEAITLRLFSFTGIRAGAWYTTAKQDKGLVAGFGPPPNKSFRGEWGKDISVEVGTPLWTPESPSQIDGEGRWSQEVLFCSSMTINCPPCFKHKYLSNSYYLQVIVRFSGLGNDVVFETSLLKITSGIFRERVHAQPIDLPVEFPPSYGEVLDDREEA
ncbi:hypothetical protein SISNIDRAFT_552506 [Sistotremastrum niveocremeum HHB9708]|uniref:Arrestin-like N-terminal domain-containing protein n=1 Tax=Sistotremastrum niveocremeum HHB9708 TaxID=1314777 RepID=A0A164PBV6_9AGAM|nr:hypothetical protein SISNIDRAFT_552506 [Sistotremastrum niveocremeum HHB9708]